MGESGRIGQRSFFYKNKISIGWRDVWFFFLIFIFCALRRENRIEGNLSMEELGNGELSILCRWPFTFSI